MIALIQALRLMIVAPVLAATSMTMASTAAAEGAAPAATSSADKIAAFESHCAASVAARQERDKKAPLYQRLGGSEQSMLRLARSMVRLHYRQDILYDVLRNYSPEQLAVKFGLYVAEITGGPKVYKGEGLARSHRALNITTAQFLAAGQDLMQAMTELGYEPEQVDDLMCIAIPLRSQIVFGKE